MAFEVYLHPKAADFLKDAEKKTRNRIKTRLKELKKEPAKGKKLKYSDFRRVRIGDYRAIYETDRKKKKVLVLFIGHRRNVYDDFSKLF